MLQAVSRSPIAAPFLRRLTSLPLSVSVRASVSPSEHLEIFFLAPTELATKHLAALLAKNRRKGDCICLHGKVGAGKSVFSRAYIRSIEEDEDLPVPSPTYLLQNVYDFIEGPAVYHFDLYRLEGASALQRVDLPTSLSSAVSLIEWADRLGAATPESRLEVHIELLASEVPVGGPNWHWLDVEHGVENDVGEYTDQRWRKICLHPYGHRWETAMQRMVEDVSAATSSLGGLQHLDRALQEKLQLQ